MKHSIYSYLKDHYQGQYNFTDIPYSYDNLVWLNEETNNPTLAELVSAVDQLNAEEPYQLLRLQRDHMLASTDRYGLDDYPFKDDTEKTAWRTYRSQLRNLPDTATPRLNANGELDQSSVTWPARPN